jgi:hypothetical protein
MAKPDIVSLPKLVFSAEGFSRSTTSLSEIIKEERLSRSYKAVLITWGVSFCGFAIAILYSDLSESVVLGSTIQQFPAPLHEYSNTPKPGLGILQGERQT